jgi:hypothetical protein
VSQAPPLVVASRRPVWEALSSLFLDTDTSLSRQWRAELLATSQYSVQEIETILLEEVYPVCSGNLFEIAGEWAGFDPEWLEQQILKRKRASPGWLPRLSVARWVMRLSQEWPRTLAEINALRRDSSSREG